MKKVTIEELAYWLKKAKEQGEPKPIFFWAQVHPSPGIFLWRTKLRNRYHKVIQATLQLKA